MRRGTFLVFLAASVLLAPPARAQDAKDAQAQAAARSLFNEGVALMNEGRLVEACPKLEASLERFPGLGTRGKLAECYERTGRAASAWRAYKEVAELAGRAGEAAREKVASERARALEPSLAYLTVAAPVREVAGLSVRKNGKDMPLGVAEPVDAGLVRIDATAPGRKPFSAQLVVAAGQTAKLDVPVLEPASAPSDKRTASREPTPSPAASSVAPRENPTRGSAGWQKPVGPSRSKLCVAWNLGKAAAIEIYNAAAT